MRKRFLGIPVVLLVLAAISLVAGVALAGIVVVHHGQVQVVQQGGTGGGGGGPGGGNPLPTYTFAVYDAVTGGTEIADNDSAFWNLGTINVNSFVEKTVYIQKTGNQTLTVTPTVSGLDAASGNFTFTPTSVTVSDATRQSIVIRFTSGPSPTVALDAFDITFTESH